MHEEMSITKREKSQKWENSFLCGKLTGFALKKSIS
jgi:hypothetical protein